MRNRRNVLGALALLALLFTTGCIVAVHRVRVAEVTARPTEVSSPTKAHLRDGSVILFPSGFRVLSDALSGEGTLYDLQRSLVGPVRFISIDSVVGLETYRREVDLASSVLLSAPATLAGIYGSALLLVAIFGSCPTFYSDSAGTRRLEAEGFSYSIAPLLEMRDVDALRGSPVGASFDIQVLNEALETHYLNHLELLAVRHRPDQRVLPDARGFPVVISQALAPQRARDGAGRNVSEVLRTTDQQVFSSQSKRLSRVSESVLQDFIELEFPATGADSAALVLRLRNSLLSTVLLYDVMMADAGAQSLDWIGKQLDQIGSVSQLGKWYASRMGLRVEAPDGTGWKVVARLGDTGPIAWKDVALVVPTAREGTVRLRLSFPTDGWRIDRIELATMERPDSVHTLPVAEVQLANGQADSASRAMLLAPDDRYLITEPGQRVTVRFPALTPHLEERVTYHLASQGYYIEWLRPDWLKHSPQRSFTPSDEALFEALCRWQSSKSTFERQFYSTAIPVR